MNGALPSLVVVALALVGAAPIAAAEEPARKFEAAVKPIDGAHACAALPSLESGFREVAAATPTGSAVDDATWKGGREEITLTLAAVAKACKANDAATAQKKMDNLRRAARALVLMATPRALPAPVQAFDGALRKVWARDLKARHSNACADARALRKGFDAVAREPAAGVDAKKWNDGYGTIDEALGFMAGSCKQPTRTRDSDSGNADSDLERIHENFYEGLVLALLAVP